MATFKHYPTGERFLFIHIPRTAGRFIIMNLFNNGCLWDDLHLRKKMMYDVYEGTEIGHFHREYYEKYLKVKDIPHIAIVRNPITRFKSSSFYLKRYCGDEIERVMEDPKKFFSILDAISGDNFSRNWYRPQVEFISSETHIWKFEDGFGSDFTKWINDITKVDFTFDKDVKYPEWVIFAPDKDNKFTLTSKHISNIMDYYNEDIQQLYPELLNGNF
tara:strand:- start:352 stop:1002 length:651 start_codon:yes stop_codon:yes gene_type:complete